MRRTTVAAAGAALLTSAALAAPAHADVLSDNCNTIFDDGLGGTAKVCLAVTWHRLGGGPGINIDRIQTSVNTNGDWNSTAVDCTSLLVMRNDPPDHDHEVHWRKDGNACDVQMPPGNHEYGPDVAMPAAQCMWVQWNGNANISGAPDRDFTISVKACR